MKTYILSIALLLSTAIYASKNPVLESELSFKITYHNLQLGYVKAIKHASAIRNTYTVFGKAESDLFLKKIVSENCIHSIFEDNKLLSAVTFVKRNGKTLSNTSTKLLQEKYIISSIEQISQLKRNEIDFTVALLYFQEPLGIENIYSEAWGKILPLNSHNNEYRFTIPDGTVCTFKYKNGVLEEVTSNTVIGEIKFTRE
ncbi:MAG TPA: DUF6134 family protein [Bacteroidia bacterium]|jgi:hypothetical protein|nr:DUF6134 family protein [Bacteroidia bacterium]